MKMQVISSILLIMTTFNIFSMDNVPREEELKKIKNIMNSLNLKPSCQQINANQQKQSPRKLYSCLILNDEQLNKRITLAEIDGQLSVDVLGENDVTVLLVVSEQHASSYLLGSNHAICVEDFIIHDDQQLWVKDKWVTSLEMVREFISIFTNRTKADKKIAVFCPGNDSTVNILCACLLAEKTVKQKRISEGISVQLQKTTQENSESFQQDQEEAKNTLIEDLYFNVLKQLLNVVDEKLIEAIEYALTPEQRAFIKFYCAKQFEQPHLVKSPRGSGRRLINSGRGKKKK